jgi:D-aminopeptidase
MTLTSEQLKKIATEHIKKESPELKDVEPTIQEEERSIPQKVERKLGLEHPKKTPANAKVFTFKKTVTAEDGAQIPIVSKVTIDENGNIIKSTGN